jgi:hypothetical protein
VVSGGASDIIICEFVETRSEAERSATLAAYDAAPRYF